MARRAASFTSRVVAPTSNDPRARLGLVIPPLLALIYPFLLDGFHASAVAGRQGAAAAWVVAALFLVAAFAVSDQPPLRLTLEGFPRGREPDSIQVSDSRQGVLWVRQLRSPAMVTRRES